VQCKLQPLRSVKIPDASLERGDSSLVVEESLVAVVYHEMLPLELSGDIAALNSARCAAPSRPLADSTQLPEYSSRSPRQPTAFFTSEPIDASSVGVSSESA
jgi:hypothetical protein